MGYQRPDDADMGKAAGGAAAQRQPDYWPADAAEPYLVVIIGAFLAAAHPAIQHANSPAATTIFAVARLRQTSPFQSACMVYARRKRPGM
jgi:hypothetical protein